MAQQPVYEGEDHIPSVVHRLVRPIWRTAGMEAGEPTICLVAFAREAETDSIVRGVAGRPAEFGMLGADFVYSVCFVGGEVVLYDGDGVDAKRWYVRGRLSRGRCFERALE